MAVDLPCMSYMALYVISMHILHTNSKTSTHWKLNIETGKVQTAASAVAGSDETGADGVEDPIMSILTNTVPLVNGGWRLEAESVCSETDCQNYSASSTGAENSESNSSADSIQVDVQQVPSSPDINTSTSTTGSSSSNQQNSSQKAKKERKKTILDCGKPVNLTEYDHLRGISDRKSHPHIPEPEVALIFKKKDSRNSEVDMADLERKLKKAKKEKPKSAQVYNQIGNFWRIKGHTQHSIECFRKALYISPNNADVLLNLARVLFNLQYLDDAIFLTRHSLKQQAPAAGNSWLQHFTLGEILKAYGHVHEAALHFRHSLDLNPAFGPAEAHLRELEVAPDATVTYYTLFIILFLVLGVLCGILTSLDGSLDDLAAASSGDAAAGKTQRHFNRAMAMRSIKLGINPKLIRMRKQINC